MTESADQVLTTEQTELIVAALEAWADASNADPDADQSSATRDEARRLAELITIHEVTLTPASQP